MARAIRPDSWIGAITAPGVERGYTMAAALSIVSATVVSVAHPEAAAWPTAVAALVSATWWVHMMRRYRAARHPASD